MLGAAIESFINVVTIIVLMWLGWKFGSWLGGWMEVAWRIARGPSRRRSDETPLHGDAQTRPPSDEGVMKMLIGSAMVYTLSERRNISHVVNGPGSGIGVGLKPLHPTEGLAVADSVFRDKVDIRMNEIKLLVGFRCGDYICTATAGEDSLGEVTEVQCTTCKEFHTLRVSEPWLLGGYIGLRRL